MAKSDSENEIENIADMGLNVHVEDFDDDFWEEIVDHYREKLHQHDEKVERMKEKKEKADEKERIKKEKAEARAAKASAKQAKEDAKEAKKKKAMEEVAPVDTDSGDETASDTDDEVPEARDLNIDPELRRMLLNQIGVINKYAAKLKNVKRLDKTARDAALKLSISAQQLEATLI
ncbi:hypothetical protein J8273_2441 [Carpediemonas membranifera]|uniref:Uncharacterized protein n=1 Tax=Carpediemonas membranifera TaxID=201153 RepID=A0A8J6B9M2_9EUKA|nr:hypothetical protein J8273_2441 [Carpediemonas membranifera]|eukprot:KAG9396089.1 hypothetical protein J8273_2441 [Carpediemonas membranifera]